MLWGRALRPLVRTPLLLHARAFSIFTGPAPPVQIPNKTFTEYTFEHFGKYGDKKAFIDGITGNAVTYSQIPTMVDNAARGLSSVGFKQGDILMIHAPNSAEYAIAFHAVAKLGGAASTSNPAYTARELAHQLHVSGARFALTTKELESVVKEAAAHEHVKLGFVHVIGTPDCFLSYQGSHVLPKVTIDPSRDLVALPFSSGTTSLPKGVKLTHRNLVANVCQLLDSEVLNQDVHQDDVVIAVLPFFHIYGMVLIMTSSLRRGASIVTLPKFDPVVFLEAMQKYRVTWGPFVPPLVIFLARHELVNKFDLSSLRAAFCGAAPLSAELQQQFFKRFGIQMRQGYGMTEMSPVSHMQPSHDNTSGLLLTPGSIGYPIANIECKVVTEDGKEGGVGEWGELWCRGPNIMAGYLDNETATAATIDKDGFLHTGDVCYRDEDGCFHIVDRMKELIKYKGFQVAPAELEGLLLAHESIADCAVLPQQDDEAGEVPKAFVVVKPDSKLTEDDVKDFIKGQVAKHKQIRIVEFVSIIPKSASGKILKRILKQQK